MDWYNGDIQNRAGEFPMSERAQRALLWAAAIGILTACLLGLYCTGFFEAAATEEGLRDYMDRSAPWSYVVFFGIQLASVIIAPIPSNITAAAGAVLFGLWPSFLLTWAAVALGSVLVFLLARGLGQKFVGKLVGQKLSDKYLSVIQRKRDTFLALAFLFPFFPDDLLCILAGLTDIPLRRFVILVLAARPWGLLAACGVGSSVVSIPLGGMAAIGLAGLAVFLLALKYGDRIENALLEKLRK